jgi:sporulation protein YabP
MGYLALKGEDLELVKLDTLAGSVTIKGHVSSFDYIEDSKTKDKDGSIISRLFK